MLDAQARAAMAQARRLLTNERVFRIDQQVQPGLVRLDDARDLPDLLSRGTYSGRHCTDVILREFLSEPAVPFRPLHVAKRAI